MSGISASGKIMIQEPCASGFDVNVYPTRLAAAIQLLRVEIRRAQDSEAMASLVEREVINLVAGERSALLDDGGLPE